MSALRSHLRSSSSGARYLESPSIISVLFKSFTVTDNPKSPEILLVSGYFTQFNKLRCSGNRTSRKLTCLVMARKTLKSTIEKLIFGPFCHFLLFLINSEKYTFIKEKSTFKFVWKCCSYRNFSFSFDFIKCVEKIWGWTICQGSKNGRIMKFFMIPSGSI